MTLAEQHLEGRDALLQAVRLELAGAATARYHDVNSDDQLFIDGEAVPETTSPLKMLTRRDVEEILEATFNQPLPAPVETAAEVRTPAEIRVAAICPRCHLPGTILLEVEPLLEQDSAGSRLKLKAKAKAKPHTCGQLELPTRRNGDDAPEDSDQTELPFHYGGEPDPLGEVSTDVTEPEVEIAEPTPELAYPVPEVEVDLRPTGEVNADELRGVVDRASEPTSTKGRRRKRVADDPDGDLLPE